MTTIPVVGTSDVFPVRRIYCIGRNYAAHAREMGSDPTREPPFFFQKPTDAIQYVAPGSTVNHPYPSLTKNCHYEIELVAALKSGGKNIAIADALQHVYGYAIGLDMTRRDLQRGMGDEKKPWEIGKSFDMSAPIGPIHPVAKVGHYTKGAISLAVNGAVCQGRLTLIGNDYVNAGYLVAVVDRCGIQGEGYGCKQGYGCRCDATILNPRQCRFLNECIAILD